MSYLLHILIMVSIYSILSLSLNISVGYAGLLSLSQAAFYGIGAYTVTLLMIKANFNFFLALPMAIIFSGILSLFVSYPSTRLRGDYFILISFAFQIIIYTALYNWVGFTNGPYGISDIPKPGILFIKIDSLYSFSILACSMVVVVFFLTKRLLVSPFGLVLKAIREDELAAISLGKNIRKFKIISIAISSGLAAIAGSLYASYLTYIDPTSFNLNESLFILSIVLVGGSGNLRGPIIGSFFMILLPEALRFVGLPDSMAPNVRQIIYALLLIFFMKYRPQGIAGEYRFG